MRRDLRIRSLICQFAKKGAWLAGIPNSCEVTGADDTQVRVKFLAEIEATQFIKYTKYINLQETNFRSWFPFCERKKVDVSCKLQAESSKRRGNTDNTDVRYCVEPRHKRANPKVQKDRRRKG